MTERDAAILERYGAGAPIKAIAADYGLSTNGVIAVVKRRGGELRLPMEQRLRRVLAQRWRREREAMA